MDSSNWLALESSTDTLSLAVARGPQVWTHTRAGGALSSAHMIPQTLALLEQADLQLRDLQAVVFGRGPGSFTGLRTACSVAQGLALGADLPVLPIDTLLAVAEEARVVHAVGVTEPLRILAVLDARMGQVYVAAYEFTPNSGAALSADADVLCPPAGRWRCVQAPALQNPEALHWPDSWPQGDKTVLAADYPASKQRGWPFIAAGNAWPVYAAHWPAALTAPQCLTLPTAAALLRLAPAAWAAGEAVPPEAALPLYIRDKVAQTTAERGLTQTPQAPQAAP